MAKAVLEHRLSETSPELATAVNVDSAGLDAIVGQPAADGTKRVLQEQGIEAKPHLSALFEDQHADADLILTMTTAHKDRILATYPHAASRVYTLNEYAQMETSPDIADPFMGGDDAYRRAFKEIDAAVRKVIDRLTDEVKQ